MDNSITVVGADLVASLDGSVCFFFCFFFFPRLGCQIASLCFNGMIIIVSYSVHPKPSPAAPSTDWQTHGNLTNLFWPPLNQVVCEIIWLCIFPLGKLKNWWLGFFCFFFCLLSPPTPPPSRSSSSNCPALISRSLSAYSIYPPQKSW